MKPLWIIDLYTCANAMELVYQLRANLGPAGEKWDFLDLTNIYFYGEIYYTYAILLAEFINE